MFVNARQLKAQKPTVFVNRGVLTLADAVQHSRVTVIAEDWQNLWSTAKLAGSNLDT